MTNLRAIYLNDHLAVVVGGRELAKRIRGEYDDEELRAFADELRDELEESEREVVRLVRAAGGRPSPLKRYGAWAGEKAGRLKLNGQLRGRSPLSRVVELEGVRFVLEGERMLWRTLERLDPDGGHGRRAEAAERLLGRAEELRLAAAERAL